MGSIESAPGPVPSGELSPAEEDALGFESAEAGDGVRQRRKRSPIPDPSALWRRIGHRRPKPEHKLMPEGVRRIREGLRERTRHTEILLDALTERLTNGNLPLFDARSVELLQQVLKDDARAPILQRVRKLLPGVMLAITPMAARVGSFYGAYKYREYEASQELARYLFDTHGFFGSIGRSMNKAFILPALDKIIQGRALVAGVEALVIAGGIAGGAVGVIRERRRDTGFEPIAELIERAKEANRMNTVDEDPRLQLVALQKRYLQDPHARRKLTNEQWVSFAAAIRAARISLIREKTAASQIVIDEEVERRLKAQEILVDRIIGDQRELAEIDRDTAKALLAKFEAVVERESAKESLGELGEQSRLEKAWRYATAFVRDGFAATGIPLLWRGLRATTGAYRSLRHPFKSRRK